MAEKDKKDEESDKNRAHTNEQMPKLPKKLNFEEKKKSPSKSLSELFEIYTNSEKSNFAFEDVYVNHILKKVGCICEDKKLRIFIGLIVQQIVCTVLKDCRSFEKHFQTKESFEDSQNLTFKSLQFVIKQNGLDLNKYFV
ncbi:hypothetical protein MHBO_002282 [Bonamia ostreae]|uniref:Uncharacterized protein n=1 Tax=Bonamia ostreae TaxID=126728 RepID=A0ABV2ALU3_9EUKA